MLGNSFFEIFLFSFVLGLGGAVSPGPVSTAIISQAPRQGWRVGPLIALGHSLLELLVVVLIAFGLQRFLSQSIFQIAISFLGGLLLIFLGTSMLIDLRRGKIRLPNKNESGEQSKIRKVVWLGVATTLANPFWFAWWITVPTSYLAQAGALEALPLAAFYLGHISADFAWDSSLASFVAGERPWMNDKLYGLIIAVSGLFLVYLGASFLIEGFRLIGVF
jgi:threonine/homoserine/homoserine lactone efflux protein